MRIDSPLAPARLIRRYKRFLADVLLESGEEIVVHCPNPGRMIGCQEPDSEVIVRDSGNPKRKLRWTLQTIRVGRHWVNLDTQLANGVVEEAVLAGDVPELTGYGSLRREVGYGERSRIDILLEDPKRPACYVEVKSTTLVRGQVASFPDAVTARGLKHLRELEVVVKSGKRAVMFFLVCRADARRFEPADDIDPAYGQGLREAIATGVEAVAYTARVRPNSISVGRRIDVGMGAGSS